MSFTFQRLRFSFWWEVKRSDGLLMFVGPRDQAEGYCQRKNAEIAVGSMQ